MKTVTWFLGPGFSLPFVWLRFLSGAGTVERNNKANLYIWLLKQNTHGIISAARKRSHDFTLRSNDNWTRTRTVELIRNETSLRAPVQSSPSPVQSNGLDRLWHISDDQSNQNSSRGAPRAFLLLSFFCTSPPFADPFNAAFYCVDCTSFCSDFLPVRSLAYCSIILLFSHFSCWVVHYSEDAQEPKCPLFLRKSESGYYKDKKKKNTTFERLHLLKRPTEVRCSLWLILLAVYTSEQFRQANNYLRAGWAIPFIVI